MGFIFGTIFGLFIGIIVGGAIMWRWGNLRFDKPDISTKEKP